MMRVRMDNTEIRITNLSYEGMDKVFHDYERFIDEIKGKLDLISELDYTSVELFNIDFKWIKSANNRIEVCCNDESWNITSDEYTQLYG